MGQAGKPGQGSGNTRHLGQWRRAATRLLGVLLVGWSVAASALSFGSLSVDSSLNEPFDARLVLSGLSGADGDITVRMARPAAFERLGVPRAALVDRLQIATASLSAGRIGVRLRTRQPVADPFVSFVLEVQAGGATSLHEYTALLDPASGSASSPRASNAIQNRPAPSQAAAPVSPATGPVRVAPGDTLWAIAADHTPAGANVAQTALAIYQSNPQAFGNGPQSLQAGARLSLPDARQIRDIAPARARQALAPKAAPAGPSSSGNGGPDARTSLAASGEDAPPPSALTGTPDRSAPGESRGSDAAPGVFGQLVPPDPAPFEAASTGDGPAASPREDGPADSQNDGAAVSAPGQAGASDTPAQPAQTPPAAPEPASAASGSSGGWLSTRSLIVLLVLLLLVLFFVRRRQAARATAEPKTAEARPEPARRTPPVAESAPREAAYRQPAPTGPAEPAWLAGATVSTRPAPAEARPEAERTGTPTREAEPAYPPEPAKPVDTSDRGESLDRAARLLAADDDADAPSNDAPRRHVRDDSLDEKAPAARSEPADTSLSFEPTTITSQPRRHDQGDTGQGLFFESAAMTDDRVASAARPHSRETKTDSYDLEMIDPGRFDLYDAPSPDAAERDNAAHDSLQMRLDLARMYIDMDDIQAARELAQDVHERGDEAQRQAAIDLLDSLPADPDEPGSGDAEPDDDDAR